MKKVNFDQIQNFEVPQEWIDKALNAAPKPTPFLRRPYVIGSMIGIGVILVAVIVLILVNPFQNNYNPQNPATAVFTEATDATQGASELETAMTEAETTPEDADATQGVEDAGTDENAVEKKTDKDESEKNNDSETTNDREDAVKYRIKDTWYVDTRAEKSGQVPEMNDTSLELEKDELFTGDITIIISPNSSFYNAEVIRLAAYGVYEPAGQEIDGYGYLEPEESENGEKIIRFNLFDEGAYTPSAEGYSFSFNYSDNMGNAARDMVTVDLVSDKPVTITL